MDCTGEVQKLECWSNGVLEYWGIFPRPLLQYSIIPLLRLFSSEDI
jgi:hypothetical protein